MDHIIVQAGGKGTRLCRLTRNKPKALVPVDNLPMLYHLFRKYPDKKFIIIADYHKEVLRSYLSAFPEVKYLVVDAKGTGTCGGIRQALELLPDGEAFMLIWSDLILPEDFSLPESYGQAGKPTDDHIGISRTFPCRWSYVDGTFTEECSCEHGVAGFFLFSDKTKLKAVPESGELVRWMQRERMQFREWSLAGTREFGLLEEYEKLEQMRCRPFDRITIDGDVLTKEPVDAQGAALADENLVPFGREPEILINGKKCRNVFYHKRELEERLDQLSCKNFYFIHGDPTFSNLMLREDGSPVLIDPRGYFGYSELYGDVRYDWAKLYYSIVGNYD